MSEEEPRVPPPTGRQWAGEDQLGNQLLLASQFRGSIGSKHLNSTFMHIYLQRKKLPQRTFKRTNLEQRAARGDGSQITESIDLTLLLEPGGKGELAGGMEAHSVGEVGRSGLNYSVLPRPCPVGDADLVAQKEI